MPLISKADSTLTFVEQRGIVSVEAEHYQRQYKDQVRRWYLMDGSMDLALRDVDTSVHASASNGAYLEILPDTRTNHDEKLIRGENFSNEPGLLAILDYRIRFSTPGRYYVWVRAHSTGSEDNGIHVGLNGDWPEHGQRMQWCEGKHSWHWESKQRTKEKHCGVPQQIYLDITEPGIHTVSFSMREDGFEFDKFILSQHYRSPQEAGPAESPRE
ncbi:MAG: hypothetical protein KTR24_06085 [Saprospiraceae bacterium]|nr:hypothetical protein [Saprospiraceae bacterium]